MTEFRLSDGLNCNQHQLSEQRNKADTPMQAHPILFISTPKWRTLLYVQWSWHVRMPPGNILLLLLLLGRDNQIFSIWISSLPDGSILQRIFLGELCYKPHRSLSSCTTLIKLLHICSLSFVFTLKAMDRDPHTQWVHSLKILPEVALNISAEPERKCVPPQTRMES